MNLRMPLPGRHVLASEAKTMQDQATVIALDTNSLLVNDLLAGDPSSVIVMIRASSSLFAAQVYLIESIIII